MKGGLIFCGAAMGQKIAAIFTISSLQVWQVIAAMLCWRGLSM